MQKKKLDYSKIPCVVIVYYNYDVIRKSIDFLIKDGRFDIFVIENKSPNSKKLIRPYLIDLVRSNKISLLITFGENISNNAYEIFFDYYIHLLKRYESDNILITDGDIIIENQCKINWLDEQLSILKKHDQIGACGINLSKHNLPTAYWDTKGWLPDEFGVIHEDYVETGTGIHLLLIRKNAFLGFLKERQKTNWRFADFNLRYFVTELLELKWVVTKLNYATHLTWSVYSDLSHPYTKIKIDKKFGEIWSHFKYSYFIEYCENSKKNIIPAKYIWYLLKRPYVFFKKMFK